MNLVKNFLSELSSEVEGSEIKIPLSALIRIEEKLIKKEQQLDALEKECVKKEKHIEDAQKALDTKSSVVVLTTIKDHTSFFGGGARINTTYEVNDDIITELISEIHQRDNIIKDLRNSSILEFFKKVKKPYFNCTESDIKLILTKRK